MQRLFDEDVATEPVTPDHNMAARFVDLPTYTGEDKTIVFSRWLDSIRLAHKLNAFTVDETLQLIRARVDGPARSKLEKLDRGATFTSIEALIDEIRGVFQDNSNAFSKLANVWQNGQTADENPDDLGRRIKTLMRNAMGDTYDQKLAVQIFKSALANKDVSIHVGLQKPNTIDEAIDHASNFQREVESNAKKNGSKIIDIDTSYASEPMEIDRIFRPTQRRGNGSTSSRAMGQSLKCYYCDKPGHIGPNCDLMKRHKGLMKKYETLMNRLKSSRQNGRGGRGRNNEASRQPSGRRFGRGSIREVRSVLQQLEELDLDDLMEDEDLIQELAEDEDQQPEQLDEDNHEESNDMDFQ